MELIWPYVKSHSDLSVRGYLTWVKDQQDSLYQIKFEQELRFGILAKNTNYNLGFGISAFGISALGFRIWAAEVFDEVQLMRLQPEIRDIVEKNSVVSRSGIYEQHQGLDAILEEINKILKTLIPPIPQHCH
ncbi:hypothetical protein Glove_246g10 [Diversispora epigaea]|uniref:Uncharacterized protein n=1 Tax=Diversispora epigaea TaxID=1348612 RepID=A0A397IB99_9GLOM|nr:hypothetical protein Glove_246g10 [Diversispora epigaea]